jgi:hypothetical protein
MRAGRRRVSYRPDASAEAFCTGTAQIVVLQLLKAGFIAEQGTSREGQRPERTRRSTGWP